MVRNGNYPREALFQVSELFLFTQIDEYSLNIIGIRWKEEILHRYL